MIMRRLLPPLFFGFTGMVILISLGVWQLQRLYWKQSILDDINERITSSPVAIPAALDPIEDRYLPVTETGMFGDAYIRILASRKQIGAGYRIISPMQISGRVILVDRGFVKLDVDLPPRPKVPVTITGNLHWP
ncbi:MAG: SURF1 family protein, partial [Paracoccaceae bacterium]|nr:SURF1 family protein [Paracoccaceae bacterium]